MAKITEIYYERLHTFAQFENERYGARVEVNWTTEDTYPQAVEDAKKLATDRVNEWISEREQVKTARQELHEIERQHRNLESQCNQLRSDAEKIRSWLDKIQETKDDIPF